MASLGVPRNQSVRPPVPLVSEWLHMTTGGHQRAVARSDASRKCRLKFPGQSPVLCPSSPGLSPRPARRRTARPRRRIGTAGTRLLAHTPQHHHVAAPPSQSEIPADDQTCRGGGRPMPAARNSIPGRTADWAQQIHHPRRHDTLICSHPHDILIGSHPRLTKINLPISSVDEQIGLMLIRENKGLEINEMFHV